MNTRLGDGFTPVNSGHMEAVTIRFNGEAFDRALRQRFRVPRLWILARALRRLHVCALARCPLPQ